MPLNHEPVAGSDSRWPHSRVPALAIFPAGPGYLVVNAQRPPSWTVASAERELCSLVDLLMQMYRVGILTNSDSARRARVGLFVSDTTQTGAALPPTGRSHTQDVQPQPQNK